MPTAESPPDAPPGKLTNWLAIGPALVVPCIGSLFYFVWFNDSPPGQFAYVITKSFTLLWPLIGVFLILRLRRADLLSGRSIVDHLKTGPLGVLLGLAIVGLMFLLMRTPLGAEVLAGATSVREKARGLGFDKHYVPFALFISLVHSGIEEYYWRWFVYGHLRKILALPAAHLLAALAFSAHHLVVTSQFFSFGLALFLSAAVGVGGLIWSLLYQRQGSLFAPWICHVIVDLGIMAIGHRLIFGS